MSEELIPVFDGNTFICNVEASYNLDNEEEIYVPGAHAGLTRLPDGRYIFMVLSMYSEDYSWGDVVTPAEALFLVYDSNHEELLQQEEFKDLLFQVRNTLLVPRPGQRLPGYLIH